MFHYPLLNILGILLQEDEVAFPQYGDAYLAKPHFAKSESAIQESAKPYTQYFL